MKKENIKATIKKFILPVFFLTLTVAVIFNYDFIITRVANLLENTPKIAIGETNAYTKNYDFKFVQRSHDFRPFSRGELINVFFSVINNGWESFTFYCPSEYKECLSDVKEISDDEVLLTHINNFAHPFNSFKSIETTFSESGEINLRIHKLYTPAKIRQINEHVNKVMEEVLRDDMSLERKIRALHDYMLENADYDKLYNPGRTDNINDSNTAYGVFFQGHGICSGFTDAMAIFLTRLNVKNFKIASENHVWNAVFINDRWLHLDATWNAPLNDAGQKTLWDRYFLITTEQLIKLNTTDSVDHNFDKTVYLEFRN